MSKETESKTVRIKLYDYHDVHKYIGALLTLTKKEDWYKLDNLTLYLEDNYYVRDALQYIDIKQYGDGYNIKRYHNKLYIKATVIDNVHIPRINKERDLGNELLLRIPTAQVLTLGLHLDRFM